MKARTNAEWLIALKSDGHAQATALSDLRVYLLRAALYALYRRRGTLRDFAPTDIKQLAEDCAQDALSAILKHLDQFRGDSRFTTWAYKFAVNAALVAARRERWGRVPLDRLLDSPDLVAIRLVPRRFVRPATRSIAARDPRGSPASHRDLPHEATAAGTDGGRVRGGAAG